jgi:phosphomethylpyrimidine synthase
MKISQEVRDFAAIKIVDNEVIQKGMDKKSEEFKNNGSKVYL